MARQRFLRRFDDAALARREPVWKALSTLWLGVEPRPRDLAWIAGILHASGFEPAQLHDIYLYEVAPAVHGHRPAARDEGSGFDEPWLYGRARARGERRSVWLRLPIASAWMRRRMTAATDPDWHIVVDLLTRMRARSDSLMAEL